MLKMFQYLGPKYNPVGKIFQYPQFMYYFDLETTGKFNKGIRFLLCFIDIFSKYAWVLPLKDKKGVTIVNAFQKILNDLKRKPK